MNFEERIDRSGECHVWTGARNEHGYGVGWDGKRTRLAHRMAWAKKHGPIPAGMMVCHKCDNPPCVNVDHLFLGTQTDNMSDCANKGRLEGRRTPRGSAHPQAKLTEIQVQEIREARASGILLKTLSARYGVSETMISYIARGKNWT